MNKLVLSAALAFAVLALPAQADTVPKPKSIDSRSTTALYKEGQVYKIYTQLKRVTLIELADDEKYVDFKAGDTASFVFAPTDAGNAVLVKPVMGGSVTNGVIVTTRRFYLVELYETGARNPHYAVSFTAPKSGRAAKGFTPPKGQPKSYAIAQTTKDTEFQPVRIWDDGLKTYFQFSGDAPIPSVYRADANGREYLVNGRTQGTITTVGRRSDRWVLRFGDKFVCIEAREASNG